MAIIIVITHLRVHQPELGHRTDLQPGLHLRHVPQPEPVLRTVRQQVLPHQLDLPQVLLNQLVGQRVPQHQHVLQQALLHLTDSQPMLRHQHVNLHLEIILDPPAPQVHMVEAAAVARDIAEAVEVAAVGGLVAVVAAVVVVEEDKKRITNSYSSTG